MNASKKEKQEYIMHREKGKYFMYGLITGLCIAGIVQILVNIFIES